MLVLKRTRTRCPKEELLASELVGMRTQRSTERVTTMGTCLEMSLHFRTSGMPSHTMTIVEDHPQTWTVTTVVQASRSISRILVDAPGVIRRITTIGNTTNIVERTINVSEATLMHFLHTIRFHLITESLCVDIPHRLVRTPRAVDQHPKATLLQLSLTINSIAIFKLLSMFNPTHRKRCSMTIVVTLSVSQVLNRPTKQRLARRTCHVTKTTVAFLRLQNTVLVPEVTRMDVRRATRSSSVIMETDLRATSMKLETLFRSDRTTRSVESHPTASPFKTTLLTTSRDATVQTDRLPAAT